MLELYPQISDADRKEVERRVKALEKPERKKPVNQGFNHKNTYGLSFHPHVIVFRANTYGSVIFDQTYAERQEAIYRYVMNERNGQL